MNVRFVCWQVNVFVVVTWLQHRVLAPDKHGVHFQVLWGTLNFLILPFPVHVPPIISFRFLFLWKAVIGCSWNNSRSFLLVWKIFHFLRTTSVKFGKNQFYVNINRMRFGSCYRSFSCSRSSLTSLSTFSNCSSTSFWS